MEVQDRKRNILVIDDDADIGNVLEEMLTRAGYGVMRAYSGTEAVLLMENALPLPDLILLDLMLPGISGEELLSRWDGIPVIVVSAKAGVDDKVQLLLDGAADYITKPFEGKELLARVAVQLRQNKNNDSYINTGRFVEDTLQCGDIRLSLTMRTAAVGEETVRLTKTECAILKALMQNPSQVITKSALLDRISEDTPDCMESSLKVHVSNLRKKLREAGGRGGDREYIESVWGIGFRMKI